MLQVIALIKEGNLTGAEPGVKALSDRPVR